jgi:hypothetical protein
MKLVFKDGKWRIVGKVKVGEAETDVDQEVESDETVRVMTSDQLKEGFIPKSSLDKRIERAKSAVKAELLADEEFKTEALGFWKVTPAVEGSSDKDLAERLKSEKAKWEQDNVVPLQNQVATLTSTVSTLRRNGLHSEILAAAQEAGVHEDLLKPSGPKRQPMIIAMVETNFDLDEKTNKFFVKGDGDDFEFTKNPQAGHAYMDVGEFMGDWAKANPNLAPGRKQTGPNAGDPNTPRGPVDKQAQIAKLEAEGKLNEANQLKAEVLQEQRA